LIKKYTVFVVYIAGYVMFSRDIDKSKIFLVKCLNLSISYTNRYVITYKLTHPKAKKCKE